MTTHKEALSVEDTLKLALEALESSDKLINGSGNNFGLEGAMDGYYSGCFDVDGNNKLLNQAITAIKEALAQPEQEPVVGTKTWFEDGNVVTQHLTAKDIYKEPEQEEYLSKAYRLANELRCHLAIAPAPQRTWVGLTEEEVEACFHHVDEAGIGLFDFAEAVEAKLKEKNTRNGGCL